MILRRFISNALELAAANAHDRQPDFIMKLRIPFHLYRAAKAPINDAACPGSIEGSISLR
jgi:hypothetical protein